jgi:hypothetical protein
MVSRSISASSGQFVIRLRLLAPAQRAKETMPPWLGTVDPVDDGCCVLSIGLDDLDDLPSYVGHLRMDFELIEPAEASSRLRASARRLLGALGER